MSRKPRAKGKHERAGSGRVGRVGRASIASLETEFRVTLGSRSRFCRRVDARCRINCDLLAAVRSAPNQTGWSWLAALFGSWELGSAFFGLTIHPIPIPTCPVMSCPILTRNPSLEPTSQFRPELNGIFVYAQPTDDGRSYPPPPFFRSPGRSKHPTQPTARSKSTCSHSHNQ